MVSLPSALCRRDGNSSVIVHFRLHFMLRALQPLSLEQEADILQKGVQARLQEQGLSLAAYGTITSVELTGGGWLVGLGDQGLLGVVHSSNCKELQNLKTPPHGRRETHGLTHPLLQGTCLTRTVMDYFFFPWF